MKNYSLTKTFYFTVMLMIVTEATAQSMNGFDVSNASVPVSEILRGGPPRDGIPAIDHPRFTKAKHVDFLHNKDRVIGVYRNGIAKAYPIGILNWHEIVNDKFAGEPVTVSFCPLCGTGTAFITQARALHDFGVSGLLYNSDLLLYDRKTKSLWSQLLALAISGPLQGEKLISLAVEHTTWADWRKRYPDTIVLNTDTGYRRDYSRSPYEGYESSGNIYFPVNRIDPRYHPKERVVGVTINGHIKVYPFSELARTGGKVADEINGKKMFIIFDKKHQSARIVDTNGVLLPSITSFWFAWMAFHPKSEVFTAK